MKKSNLFIIFFLSVFLSSLFFIWLERPSLKVMKSWKQSETVNYNSFDPYYFNVVEDNFDFGHVPFTISRNYFIYVGMESNEVTYGHIKNYSFEYNNDINQYLKECSVVWSPKGVTFSEPSGHVFFIPKDSFTGGR